MQKVLGQHEDGAPRGVGRLRDRIRHVATGAQVPVVQAQPVRRLEAGHQDRGDERLVHGRVRDVGVERFLLILERRRLVTRPEPASARRPCPQGSTMPERAAHERDHGEDEDSCGEQQREIGLERPGLDHRGRAR